MKGLIFISILTIILLSIWGIITQFTKEVIHSELVIGYLFIIFLSAYILNKMYKNSI